MSEPVLEAIGISKRYGQFLVNDAVDLSISAGARHALIGPNGAGKSTFVGILSGTVKPDAGRILLDNHDITYEGAERRARRGLGRTFQVTNLFSGLSVLENIFLAVSERAGISGNLTRPAARYRELIEEAEHTAVTLDLGDCRRRLLSEISYGQQRLVEIAVTLSQRPKVLLLDEPAAGIPKREMRAVIQVIGRLPADTAIILIEHDMLIVRELAAQVSVLVEGRIIASGAPADILSSEQVRAVYLGRRGARSDNRTTHV